MPAQQALRFLIGVFLSTQPRREEAIAFRDKPDFIPHGLHEGWGTSINGCSA